MKTETNQRKFQQIEVTGYVAVTKSGALVESTIRQHQGDFPTVFRRPENVPPGAEARQVRVTVAVIGEAA